MAAAGAWLLVDQARSDELSLSSIKLKLPMHVVFKGMAAQDTGAP